MKTRVVSTLSAVGGALFIAVTAGTAPVSGQAGTGTIVGHVKYMGQTPVNPIIRMGADPRCNKLYAGKRPTAPTVVVNADGGLQSVFVDLEGSFPATSAPTTPVVMDQKDCMFAPHMVGARIGQTLQVKNSDITGHNVHSLSMAGNDFNTSQPSSGMTFEYKLKAGEMLHIKCDIHTWMSGYVGIVENAYYAVSAADGSFTIANVPVGKQTVTAWHEVFGKRTQMVDVAPGKTTTVDFTYAPGQKPSAGAVIHDLLIPGDAQTATVAVLR